MENCGGGQRLPPDGDEFPATYQEFSSSSHQYQFVAAARVSSTLQVSSNCGGQQQQQQLLTGGDTEVFSKSETFKLLTAESKNNPFNSSSIPSNDFNESSNDEQDDTGVLRDSRALNSRSTTTNTDDSAYKEVATNSSEKIARKIIASSSSPMDDYPYRNGGSCGPERNVVSEKKFTISGYYGDNAGKTTESTFVPTANESPTELSPPPLPTTRPPKIDVPTPNAKNYTRIINQPQQTSQRKFLSNGDLWRQDDKSEKSVRDKIAMFSSQSSLEAPLFPSLVATTPMAQTSLPGAKRLSKYKSSEDVFADDTSLGQKEKSPFTERTRSSFDLSTSSGGEKYSPYPPSLPLTSPPGSPTSKNAPSFPASPKFSPHEAKPSIRHSKSTTFEFKSIVPTLLGASPTSTDGGTPLRTGTAYSGSLAPSPIALNRATSFSAGSTNLHSRSQSLSDLPPSPQITRTNSLASTFKRPNEDMRRTSLNQLIEQRRKGISKLRGLVIPEKEALPVSQPIVDLPEIKSRDSILLQQIPRANIHDKWGSQSSISSSISTASVPGKMTSFKMPEPQNLPKYSPAFKRKSLAVYGSSGSSTTARSSPSVTTAPASEAPKSLESICSPTRSDFSFEYVPTGGSPRSRANLRKARTEYDDSDNDSAVSSSQSSISRGFSPPVSPVPSERSTLSSERSYLSAETTSGHSFHVGESRAVTLERAQFTTRPSLSYQGSERSSSNSSSPDPRSPQQSEIYSKSHLHSHPLKRSSSTDTNCSTSSTLTSGSQASAESLSRRVLKPQSVEAINRKNILASARCRSGRDLNGSPLIQRKFSDDEETPVSKLTQENGSCKDVHRGINGKQTTSADVKIAYIDVTETFVGNDESASEAPKLSPKRNFANTPEKTLTPEASNDLKKWVRAEVKTLVNYSTKESSPPPSSPPSGVSKLEQKKPADVEVHLRSPRRRSSLITEGKSTADILLTPRSRSSLIVDGEQSVISSLQNSKPRSRSSLVLEKNSDCQNDLLTVLSTKSRSRSTIHVEERSFSSLKTQMSLEEILDGKGDLTVRETTPANIGSAQRSWGKDLKFTSKIPTPERPKLSDRTAEEGNPRDEANQKLNSSRIPTPRSLGRRSASVTDMKRAIEKSEQNSSGGITSQFQHHSSTTNSHSRFPSLDSSVDEGGQRDIMDSERYSTNEQFGSISSLASSTSLISQQELAQLVEEATLEEPRGAHDVIVVLYHKENPAGSVGIALAGGVDCETKEITVHRVLAHSIADKDGRVQRGDRILSINGRSTKGLSHRESLAVLKQPRSEVVLVVSRARDDFGGRLRSRTESVETIVEGSESNGGTDEQTAWGPPVTVAIFKDGAGLGFSLEGGRDSPLGDRPLIVKKIFTGGAAEKTGALRAGDQILEVNGSDVTRMSRIEAWSLMKKLHDGEVSLLVRHPATKSSF
ncbi:PDZ domain-containing protein 2 [Athalia rosae]|uniref:PDZ domain-containing protein 2 n=1 Tax=Athalia rosae TaxID=37344 RepID=UPI0020334D3D|nr:PDZ domain-containing protein 2 [Athalia rosae]XP_048513226.1 PDZ domain-containing protein 2 [Athalia rosae]